MKRLILASSLIAVILLGSTLSIFWTKNYVEQSCSRLEEIYNAPAEEAASMLSDFQKEWEKKHILLGTFIEEAPLEKAEDSLRKAAAFLKEGEEPQFRAELRQAIRLFDDIYRHELPTLHNIL